MSAGHQPHASADPVDRALARAHGVLPDQGPIGVFIHHNTLHAFQHLPFHQAVQMGADQLGARPYLSLREFRALIHSGRIADADLRHEIAAALGERAAALVLPGLSTGDLWHALTVSDADTDDATGLEFTVHTGIARQVADLPLWQAARARAETGPRFAAPARRTFRRHRDAIVALGGDDTDPAVHGELVRLSSGFLDHGQAHTALPGRGDGFLRAVTRLYAGGASAPRDCRGAEASLRRVFDQHIDARTVIVTALSELGVQGEDVEEYLFAAALALPGWAGMFARLERHPEEHPGGPPTALADFMAVRLLLEQAAVLRACRAARLDTTWTGLRRTALAPPERSPILDASLLWELARAAHWSPEVTAGLSNAELRALWHACAECTDLERRRVCHNAFERTYLRMILDAMAARRTLPAHRVDGRPRAQFVFCIDEREESIRRALEEQHPGYITFGAAGFFGVAIDYQGLYDHEPAAYCPVVVTPGHEVYEQPVYTDLNWHTLRLGLRDRWHSLERRATRASRSLSGGAGMSFLAGPISGLNTLAHLVAPRSKPIFDERVKARLVPRPTTRLSAIRVEPGQPPSNGHNGKANGKPIGFSLEETVDRVTSLLTNLGLVKDFAPIVVVLGHGSTSLNNPHESAHDCGACGGRRGGANARLFADMANRLDVRDGVRRRGIDIPADTWFVGALHDTASDAVVYYDLDALPRSQSAAFDEAHAALEHARRENARERSRRFDNADLSIGPDDALRHVEQRSASLAQPRPEYGHCTNSICIVGRRELTRGLHLDRRAFLVSYDPNVDNDHKVLERILAAVGPVGAGISLEYYFSSVDNETFGCGTKLPHNVTGLLGVMNGHQSDLRTGLPLQMVEIHEPMRLLVIVDASPEALLAVAGRQAEVAELVVKEWIQLVSVDPATGAMAVFENGGFVPYDPSPTLLPVVDRSPEWHMRTREHVTAALVRSALPQAAVGPVHAAPAVGHGEEVVQA
ncbi:MAG TPA: DUF2309 domain-containing protein [Vicinamibacterales bacterium]